jgi:hypothetical protein
LIDNLMHKAARRFAILDLEAKTPSIVHRLYEKRGQPAIGPDYG